MTGVAKWFVGAAILVAVLLVLILAAAVGGTATGLVAGQPAPDFRLTTFEGEEIQLSDLRGQVVVLNFWASWCLECELEAATLEDVWRDYGPRGVTVLGVAYTDTEPAAREFVRKWGVSYPNGSDAGGRISRAYRLTGVPETVVIDPSGRLVPLPVTGAAEPPAKLVGPIVDGGLLPPSALRALLDRLTAES